MTSTCRAVSPPDAFPLKLGILSSVFTLHVVILAVFLTLTNTPHRVRDHQPPPPEPMVMVEVLTPPPVPLPITPPHPHPATLQKSPKTPPPPVSPPVRASVPPVAALKKSTASPATPQTASLPASAPLQASSPVATSTLGSTTTSAAPLLAGSSDANSVSASDTPSTTASSASNGNGFSGDGNATTPPRYGAAYLNNPAPAYPAGARRKGEQGRVVLRVLVSGNGLTKMVTLQSSSGSPQLDNAAIKSVRGWRFVPAKRGSQPIEAWVKVPIEFKLN